MFGTIGFKCAGTFVDFHCRNFLQWWSSRDVGISPRVSPKWPDGWPNSWGSLQRRFLLTKRGPVYQNQTWNTEAFNLCVRFHRREIHSHVDGEKSSVQLFFWHPARFFFVVVETHLIVTTVLGFWSSSVHVAINLKAWYQPLDGNL